MATAQQCYNWLAQFLNHRDNAGALMWGKAGHPELTGSASCGATVWATWINNGVKAAPLTFASTIYVPSAVNVARANGLWTTSYNAGFMWPVCFDWGRDGLADHIGFIVSQNPKQNYVHTIEGNTSDANGNGPRGIFLRTRLRSDILGAINPKGFYTAAPVTPPKPVTPTVTTSDWVAGAKVVTAWQKRAKTPADGKISSQDAGRKANMPAANWTTVQWAPAGKAKGSQLIRAEQKRLGLKQDGIAGPQFWKAMQADLNKRHNAKLTVDGVAGNLTVKALAADLGVK